MQRTYSRRALRRRTMDNHEHDDPPLSDPSPPRKRHKVFVEIVSPTRKGKLGTNDQNNAQNMNISSLRPAETRLEPTSGSPKTPERLSATPSHLRSGSQHSRGSIIKRMLGRSRTEPSLETTPPVEIPPVTTSNASSHTLPTTFPERETSPEASTQSSPKPLPTRNIRTYAGSSRSFLVALPVPDADLSNAVEDDTELHESYSDLRTRWGIDISEDDPQPYQGSQASVPTPLKRNALDLSQNSLPTGMMNDLKSITELRSKGESRRFLDEVGYLFEGLDGSSAIGLRRASALEIVNKLCDLDFNRRAKASDFYIRTWDKLWAARAGTSDKTIDATITFFAALAARDPRILVEVAQQEGFIPTLVEILSSFDHRKDVLTSVLAGGSDDDLKSHGILRTEITALKSLARLVSKESRSSSLSQPSARFFVSHSLATLPPSLLASQYLPTLLVNLRAELSLLEPRITAYESGLPLLPPTSTNKTDIPSLYHIEACSRLLDSYILGQWSSAGDDCSGGLPHMNGFTSELMSLCVTSSSLLEESEGEIVIARKCLCGAMRVLTLVSHDDSWWCGTALEVPHALPFATMTAVRSQARWSESRNMEPQDSSVQAFDLLCLALGLVMNWATLSPKVAVLSRVKSISPMCPGSRLCVRACRCPGQKSVLECFTTLHVQYSGDYQDDPPECAFLRGYTAILLGLLMKDDRSNQTIVMSTLPGASRSDKIKSLITHCHSFLDFCNDTVPLPSSDSPRVTPEVVAGEASGRHRATWDKKGGEIARSVISSLEMLCDT
ncbi:hypothetical protein HD554DRAFT_2097289 [Boletus coccyginus]|nr:hypothetical protein HD554DRAFT_2097289 [Boletus coccyginus]